MGENFYVKSKLKRIPNKLSSYDIVIKELGFEIFNKKSTYLELYQKSIIKYQSNQYIWYFMIDEKLTKNDYAK